MSVDYRPEYDPADVDSDYGHTGGDITVPTFTANMKPFRFWCQKALPLVYDDSLSYYEVLCKVVKQMNDFLTDLQTATGAIDQFAQQFVINQQFLNDMADQLGQNVQDLEDYINDRLEDYMTAYTQLQNYVNNYFDNLDVQQEINNKLDEMAEDGTLNDLFDPVLETWMQQKTAQIDAAIANQDAMQAQQNSRISVLEGRMDTFEGLPSGSTAGNAELVGIRTNFLGEVYPTAGDAVRASDMIASGFVSIPVTRLEEWNENEASSTYDTIQFDVSAYKGGRVVMIANMDDFLSTAESVGVGVFASNVSGKTVDQNGRAYALTSNVFPSYSAIPTQIQGEERIALYFSIPEDFSYQYLKMGFVQEIPNGDYTQPAAIVYANSWSKTQVDPTLTIAGAAADAKAAGDALDELNERFADLSDLEINSYNYNDTSNMYIGYYTTVLNGGTPGISDNWGIIVLPVVKGEKIEISGCAETGGANSVWLNSSNPADINKTAWATTANNGVKTCETNWLGLCTYNFSAVYKDIKVLTFTLKNAVEYTQEMQDIILVRENILTSDMIVLDKYWNGTTLGSSNGYRAITPIRVKEGQTISITYAAYAFTGFLPDGGTYVKLTTAGGGGPITYTAPSDGLVYITFTSANDSTEMVVINGGVPAFKVNPNVPISATLKDNVKIITVATDGSGDYTNPYTAYMAIQNDSEDSQVEIHIKAGTYSLNDQFSCPVSDTTHYVGIQLIHPYVSFIGEDPATTILEFNGSPEGEAISSAQAMTVSIFHMNFGKSYFGTIKNLTLKVKNGRYCIHPETAGKSKGNWTVENCIFNFEGNPNVTGWDGGAVGIGISHGETGHFINCKWINANLPGVVGHNNAYGYSDNPIIVPCAKLYFEDCDFNGTNFKIDNLSADTPLHDMLYLINCANINVGEFGSQGGQTAKKWFCVNEGSVITDDRFNV